MLLLVRAVVPEAHLLGGEAVSSPVAVVVDQHLPLLRVAACRHEALALRVVQPKRRARRQPMRVLDLAERVAAAVVEVHKETLGVRE